MNQYPHNYTPSIFKSFFMGGFECSSHRPRHGTRLDIIAATQHDQFALEDYARLRRVGIATARDGIRWHLIETTPYQYDFSSVLPMVRAARDTGVQIIWDLCHYGWPDDLDIFSPAFVARYAALAVAFARLLDSEGITEPVYSPVNEISFFAWASGTVGYFYPYREHLGNEVKAQLVRATIAGIEAVWGVNRSARIVHADPLINIAVHPDRPHEREHAENHMRSQYESWDMIAGLAQPHIGGKAAYLDILGGNYYPHNQWVWTAPEAGPNPTLHTDHPLYTPFRQLLIQLWERYNRPIIMAETGASDEYRPAWLRYMCGEVRSAIEAGVDVQGICLYPVLNFPWWDDGLYRENGLWGIADDEGKRPVYEPLARELALQSELFEQYFGATRSALPVR